MGKLEDIAKTLRSRKRLPFDRKLWSPGTLIVHLVKEVRTLRKNQCKPGMRCIFEYDNYIDNTYGTDSGDQPALHHGAAALNKPKRPLTLPAYDDYEDETY